MNERRAKHRPRPAEVRQNFRFPFPRSFVGRPIEIEGKQRSRIARFWSTRAAVARQRLRRPYFTRIVTAINRPRKFPLPQSEMGYKSSQSVIIFRSLLIACCEGNGVTGLNLSQVLQSMETEYLAGDCGLAILCGNYPLNALALHPRGLFLLHQLRICGLQFGITIRQTALCPNEFFIQSTVVISVAGLSSHRFLLNIFIHRQILVVPISQSTYIRKLTLKAVQRTARP